MNTAVLPDGTRVKDYWDTPSHPFRVFKSHFTPEVLPIKAYPKVKFLAMARNGIWTSSRRSTLFRRPPPRVQEPVGQLPAHVRLVHGVPQRLSAGGHAGSALLRLRQGVVAVAHEPNVLLLH